MASPTTTPPEPKNSPPKKGGVAGLALDDLHEVSRRVAATGSPGASDMASRINASVRTLRREVDQRAGVAPLALFSLSGADGKGRPLTFALCGLAASVLYAIDPSALGLAIALGAWALAELGFIGRGVSRLADLEARPMLESVDVETARARARIELADKLTAAHEAGAWEARDIYRAELARIVAADEPGDDRLFGVRPPEEVRRPAA